MPADDVVIKTVPAVRVAELTGTAESYGPHHIGPVIGPLYERLFPLLEGAGVRPAGPGIARYEEAPEGGGAVTVHAGVAVTGPVGPVGDTGVEVVELPAFEAATIVHRARWTTSCRPPRPWPAGWRRTATAPPGTPARSPWSARRTRAGG